MAVVREWLDEHPGAAHCRHPAGLLGLLATGAAKPAERLPVGKQLYVRAGLTTRILGELGASC